MTASIIRIQTEPFDLTHEIEALTEENTFLGAVASFTGKVRDRAHGADLIAMELEHYPGMTEHALETIADEARTRFGIGRVLIIHRVGRLTPGEDIVLVAAAAAHREAAFEAVRFVMDYLKTDAPFWKKEETGSGSQWVEARQSDAHARARWEGSKS